MQFDFYFIVFHLKITKFYLIKFNRVAYMNISLDYTWNWIHDYKKFDNNKLIEYSLVIKFVFACTSAD